jgi:hypothetical protein
LGLVEKAPFLATPLGNLWGGQGEEMARLNIEDCWWTDPRRSKLIKLLGEEELADGLAIRAWRVAQEFWGRGQRLIPREIFMTIEAAPKLIQAGLAEEREDSIYVKGSSQYHDWMLEKRKAAAAGGKKSAQRPRDAKGRLQKTPKQKPSTSPSESKCVQASSSSSSSSSDSSSDSSEFALPAEAPRQELPVHQLLTKYADLFKERYHTSPHIAGKEAGIAKRILKGMSLAKAEVYLEAFFQLPDSWLVKSRHPISSFESKLNEIVVFANTGSFTTKRQADQHDDMATSAMLLQQVRAGKA